ncbi:ABC transporter permease [Chloroflexus sp.]|uniref:ABC transporter permease n=1 Tax=Chloroflexus sp. TaxID=1904827 RepID=UPI00298F0B34|nr:ABC transporter permease [Chloroflexus sp.]MDW8402599.1 ABC transporter permease [Chloroflexus sp.]
MAQAATETGVHPSALRQIWDRWSGILVPILAVFSALVVGAFIIGITGADWQAAYIGLWEGAFGSPRAIADTVVRSTPFIICGLAVALAFKAGLFNIGAEGQLYAGAVAAVVIGTTLQMPAIFHIPATLIAGALGGAAWAAIAGFLKARTGAHEVINTIMLNYIALRMTDWLIRSKTPYILGDPADTTGARSRLIAETARLPGIQVGSSTILHLGIPLAIVLVFVIAWLLYRTTLGFEMRTAGTNPNAARYAGISVPRTIVLAMAFAGGLAGVAGAIEVAGVRGALSADFFSGLGFDAIAVALLARANPVGIIFSGLLWGGLLTGARLMQVRASLSIDVIKIVQALIIMFVAADQIVRFLYRLPKRKPGEETQLSKGWGG